MGMSTLLGQKFFKVDKWIGRWAAPIISSGKQFPNPPTIEWVREREKDGRGGSALTEVDCTRALS